MAAGKHVAVLMGGWSSERPVSLASGKACADGLEAAGYQVTRVDVGRDVADVLANLKPDVVFNALHGPFGEDGCVQGILEVLGIPYTHSGVMASALAMNKEKAKAVAAAAGVPVAEHRIVGRDAVSKSHVLPPPYVVKPIAEGSSFGVIIVAKDQPCPPQSLDGEGWGFGDDVMVEHYVAGRELTCAVMGTEALGVTEILPTGPGFYDYDAKYVAGGSRHIVPAPLKDFVYQNIRKLALEAHRAIGCRGISRSDFRFDEDGTGELVWLEVNTQPGMTPTSLVPELAAHAGIGFSELMTWMVEDASCRR
ncbi:D-alanine-D-alanine ligase [Faunimonas pinastri]|uniref:D-alanine--D-alanine ligase n=1 Tax=Faunimonas pinastri TaxID=1855383 RepID=A0A1H9FS43_9HYPH|nr:D-alanine--D-alanine ligase [Faunimonas pinastri]SEQ40288.1 D-alanine-D-alanine ligase [Faunimonas pinastri]